MPPSRKSNGRKIVLLGIPSCIGANVPGCESAPGAIRKKLLKNNSIHDAGDIPLKVSCGRSERHQKCALGISQIHKQSADFIRRKLATKGKLKHVFPVLLGGDHSVNIPLVQAMARSVTPKKMGLIWMDAHGDFNTPATTKSGNIHGMVVSSLVGLWGILKKEHCIDPKKICLIGTRNLDPKEEKLLKKQGIKTIPMKEVQKRGVAASLKKALGIVEEDTAGFYLSIDMDVFDPSIAPGVDTPVKNGFLMRDVGVILDTLAKSRIIGMDVVEMNPSLDKQGKTAKLAAKLISRIIKNL